MHQYNNNNNKAKLPKYQVTVIQNFKNFLRVPCHDKLQDTSTFLQDRTKRETYIFYPEQQKNTIFNQKYNT